MNNETLQPKLVSIAMATYNGQQFLQEQLESIIAQTYKNFEIVISDDGSVDGTVDIINSFVNKYSFIHFFKNENIHGVNKNFENAVKHCKGEYISICDQDDIWLPNKIEMLLNNIGNAALIYHNSLFVDEAGKSLNKTINDKRNCYSGNDPKVFFLLNCVSGHECMFHKNLLQFALPFPTVKYYDWWLAFVATQHGGVKYLNEILVHYRQHEKSKTDMLSLKKNTVHKKEFIIYNEEMEWFNNCAVVAETDKLFFEKWAHLYNDRKNQWFSFSLFLLARKNKKMLYSLKNKNNLSKFFESLKLLWGLKTKKLIG